MIEFIATEIGYYEEYDTISCGASNADSNVDYHYINFQRASEIGGQDDEGIYFEFDDQINGGYNTVEHCSLSDNELVIKLTKDFEKMPDETITVTFQTFSSDGLLPIDQGLKKVFIEHENKLEIHT